jgi:hypothetical protein
MVEKKVCLRLLFSWMTSDVIGYLDFAGVAATLKDIEELPPRD